MPNTKHCNWGWGPVSKLLPKWLLKKIKWEGCQEDLAILPGEEVNYCTKHGCSFCQYKNHVETKVGTTNKECCLSCKAEAEKLLTKANDEMEVKNLCWEVDDKANDLSAKLKNIYLSFYENNRKAKEQLDNLKKKVFNKEIALDNDQHSATIENIIDSCSFLKESEKAEWKNIYKNVSPDPDKLIKILPPEQNLLVALANKHLQEQRKQIIQEIKAELASSPSVNITELPSTYHNYETWTVNDLVNGKDAIIKAIQTKRVQKQLQGLLNQANNCSDSDLWNFIQKLEKLLSNTASPTEQAFYSTHQNLVDATLSGLKQRWNNLSEAQKLVGYWNNAIQNFANWLKEAENLQLAADDPFANFKENIKKEKTPAAIANQEKEAYQHILNVFKEVVKQSLGLEQQSGEYQEIEHGQNFAEVKLAWNNIQRSRQNSDSPTLPNNNAPNVPSPSPEKPRDKKKDGPKSSPNHSSNLTSKIVMGTTTIIGGSVILVLVGMIMKRWRRRWEMAKD